MAEIFVGAVVTVLFEKLASADFIKLARTEGIDSQLNKWKQTLSQIQAVISDAEQKQIREKSVELWLHDLQDLAYDIDDALDDIATKAMRRNFNQESNYSSTSTNKVFKFIPTCCTNLTPRNIMYGRKMSSKLDAITSKLHNLAEQKNTLGLNVIVNVERSNIKDKKLVETSLVEESKVVGREEDKEALLEKLLGNEACNQNVSIVSIVGLGGIGKTTLAKVLYNDERVRDHFELWAWVCVSEEFDVLKISNAIFQEVTKKNEEFTNLNLLHATLKEKLSNKRFLVVLDDDWNENPEKWELLRNPFVGGAPGSKIIVTSRKTNVASVMDSSQSYNLEALSEAKALSLLARCALNEQNFEKHTSLKEHGEGIVKKCGRLPLALITLGRVLRGKKDDDEWKEVLNSEIWHLEDGILPALRLSYYDLPSHLKQLFAYCSLFPKDYVFDKKELVLLWMAEGFLNQTNGSKSKEKLGGEYFEKLKSRSFFQTSTNQSRYIMHDLINDDQPRYIMHDLINDLATSVAGEFFFRLDDKIDANDENEYFEKFRHVSFIGEEYEAYRKFKELHRARGLRTFLPVSLNRWSSFKLPENVLAELLPQLQLLRVLNLRYHSITKVPQSIGSLKHIRYLNFSETSIERLPEEVSDLYNLQTLLLRRCQMLSTLPVSFVKLINLRHLDISDTPMLNKMPLGIGGLTCLQTLSKVIIEGGNGFKISELKGLPDLEGRLSIMGLDKVISPIEANEAKLQQKKGLDDLVMEWSDDDFDDFRNHMNEYKVLEELRPHHKLRKLEILFYGGIKFPSWVGDPSFGELTRLTLRGCRRCTRLPALGHLQSLRQVHISGCESLESYNCPNSVETLDIWSCDSLTSLTFSTTLELPSSLKSLSVACCPNLESISDKGFGPIPLESLRINNCKNLKVLVHREHWESLTSLTLLDITYCPSMDYSFPCGLWPPNLESLRIGYLNKPMSEWGMQNYPPSLVHLVLYGENSGVVSFVANAKDVTSSSFLLPPSLTELSIKWFMDVESVSEVLQHLPCLKQLKIFSCPKIKDLRDHPSSLEIRRG